MADAHKLNEKWMRNRRRPTCAFSLSFFIVFMLIRWIEPRIIRKNYSMVDSEWNFVCRFICTSMSCHWQPAAYGCVQSNEYNSVLLGYTCNRCRCRHRRKFFSRISAHTCPIIYEPTFFYYYDYYVRCVPASTAVAKLLEKFSVPVCAPKCVCVCVYGSEDVVSWRP